MSCKHCSSITKKKKKTREPIHLQLSIENKTEDNKNLHQTIVFNSLIDEY